MATLTLQTKRGPLGPRDPLERVELVPNAPLWEYVPQRFRDADVVVIRLNNDTITVDDLHLLVPQPGDVLSLTPIAGVVSALVGAAVSIVIGVALKVCEFQMERYQRVRARHRAWHTAVGPSYGFDVMQNETDAGSVLPVVLGRHRVGGVVLSQFTRRHEEGVDELHTLLAFSQGPISSYGDVHIDGNDLLQYHAATCNYNTGTLTQPALPGNEGTPKATALSLQLLSGIGVQLLGTISADWGLDKITFLTGLYHSNDSGGQNAEMFSYRVRLRPSGGAWGNWNVAGIVNGQSAAGTSVLYVHQVHGLKPGSAFYDTPPPNQCAIVIGRGTAREETSDITNVSPGHFHLAGNLKYTHTAAQADEVELIRNFNFERRRTTAFSLYHETRYPTAGVWDREYERRSGDHNGSTVFGDAYLKEMQEIANLAQTMPRVALANVSAVANDQLSGQVQRITGVADGHLFQTMTSASAFAAASFTRNPADILLGVLYNREWGAGSKIDRTFDLTMTGGAGNFMVGEKVTGPASNLQFVGRVVSWTLATLSLVVESKEGLPHGLLTGASSGAGRTVATVDDARGVSLAKCWAFHQWCDEYVSDLSGDMSTVDQSTIVGGASVYVASTTPFAVGDYVIIDPDGARAEYRLVDGITAGVSLQLHTGMTYAHTVAQADEVHVAEKRCFFDFILEGSEDAMAFARRVARVCQAEAWQQDGRVCIRAYKLETPTQMVCEGNIIFEGKDTTKVHGQGVGDRPNRMTLFYLDETLDYSRTPATVPDELAEAAGEEINPYDLEDFGTVRRSQALRNGVFRLKKLRYCGKRIEFSMGIESLNIEPMDVFLFGDSITCDGYGSGRVESAGAGYVVLDHPITYPAGTIPIWVRHADDSIESQVLLTSAGTHKRVEITGSWTQTPARGDVYILGTPGRYRALSVTLTPDLRAVIQAEQDGIAYYVYDIGIKPDFTVDDLPDPKEMPAPVTGLALKEEAWVDRGGILHCGIIASWNKAASNSTSKCEVWSRPTSGQRYVQGTEGRVGGSASGEFDSPRGCCRDATYLYIADSRNHCIRKHLALDGSWVADLGSYGTGDGQLDEPTDVTTDGTHLWIVDTNNSRVQKWTVAGAFVAKLGANGAGADQFAFPNGIVKSGSYVYVSDTWNHRLAKIDAALVGSGGGTWTAFGTQGSGDSQFERPMGLDTDGTSLWIADCGNSRLKKHLCSDLSFKAKIGSFGDGNDQFKYPLDVACDSTGATLWVADTSNNRISRRLGADALTFVAKVGTIGYLRDEFRAPSGICQYDGAIYLTEMMNHRVQERDDAEENGSPYELAGETDKQDFTIPGVAKGETYSVSVVPVSPFGCKVDPEDGTEGSILILGRTAAPPNVPGLHAFPCGPNVRLTWKPVDCPDLLGYEFRCGTSFQLSTPCGYFPAGGTERSYGTEVIVSSPAVGQTSTWWVRAESANGGFSATPGSVSYTKPLPIPAAPPSFGWNWGA